MNLRKSIVALCWVVLIQVGVAGTLPLNSTLLPFVDKKLDFALQQQLKMAKSVVSRSGKFPVTLDKKGELVLCDTSSWTCGFFPGTLWYLYESSGDNQMKEFAELYSSRLNGMEYATNTHDIGFIIYCSFGNGFRLTNNKAYRDKIVKAAESLCVRFNPITGCIKSWDWGAGIYPVIIDNMMNLELLFEASKITGNPIYRNVAVTHANTTLKNHFRDDASTYHVVFYNPVNGDVVERKTRQGFADESAWSRGQAWALYGYTMCYRETHDVAYLQQAQKIAAFILNHPRLPDDKIPYWDFDDPKIPEASRDASAGAIISSALIELSQYVTPGFASQYLQVATTQLVSLSSPGFLVQDSSLKYFLLNHSVGSMPDNIEVDVPLSYADYYYIEALIRYRKLMTGKPVVEVLSHAGDPSAGEPQNSVTGQFTNDICMPSSIYMLNDVQNNIFVEPVIKRWRPYNDVIRFAGTVNYQRRLERVASVKSPVEGQYVQLDLVNTDDFKTIKSVRSTIKVGQPALGADTIIISIIGDSFTYGAFFRDALLVKGYVPKLKMIGLQQVDGVPDQFDEGRPGWSMQGYFRVSKSPTGAYNGFWQPEGDARYWGATEYWKLVHEVNQFPAKQKEPKILYFTKRFAKASVLFNPLTGYKVKPVKNDIMYDNKQETFVRFTGKKWEPIAYDQYNWNFDYGKYLSMWNLPSPSILVEYLGLNDFRDMPDPGTINFEKWNSQLEAMAASYLKAVPDGKFVVMIPQSTCGLLNNTAGDFTMKQNACMWQLRKNIIEKFDARDREHIYVLDAGISVDNQDGYNSSTSDEFMLPYLEHPGINKLKVQWGNPHPYPNYPVMGIPLAAFIQRHR